MMASTSASPSASMTKSSFISEEVILLIKRNPKVNAVVLRKVGNTLRTSVFAQYQWAVSVLGLDNEFTAHVSPMEIIYKPTGQKILFFGADDAGKLKSIIRNPNSMITKDQPKWWLNKLINPIVQREWKKAFEFESSQGDIIAHA